MKLHLGCSDDIRAGFLNVDIGPDPRKSSDQESVYAGEYQSANLNYPWPWVDNSAELIIANDVFEHIHANKPGNLGKIHCMNEAHRVLQPNGILEFTVPSVELKDGRVNPGAFADPTHATWWCWDDLFYFSEQFNSAAVSGTYGGRIEPGERFRLGPSYGITAAFRYPPVNQDRDGTWFTAPMSSPLRSWFTAPMSSPLRWYLREDAGGARTKLVARIEAVK